LGEKGLKNFKVVSISRPRLVWRLMKVDEDLLPHEMKSFSNGNFSLVAFPQSNNHMISKENETLLSED
jgi:hypothetical protein